MKSTVYIVSESFLLGNLLREPFSEHFTEVAVIPCLDAMDGTDGAVVLVDVGDAEACARALRRIRGAGQDLSSMVLLLRSEDQGAELEGLIGEVGAMLPPTTGAEDVVRICNVVNAGVCIWPRSLISTFTAGRTRQCMTRRRLGSLTVREQAVLDRLSDGDSNKSIASALNISDSTVRVHVRSVLRKLGATNRTQAALYAAGHG
ncbi:DNA-binding response regulator, NarL/FixJ family, contains REC and HTH domains [Tranquillimonas rosea]|uniref:DNA-binding response regulator, NarL/FixJ family, contains REC and HTH domains n=1 Tax=Tranquillimonas rosea TaxID=641238 RepID=A0A1H9WZP1_9RHOB|nr:response regulator transcription factor [Tranquillimonas rosea]SES39261.1 DNA-binding response regulator, NarL/FixJ family, contains REC and HTH domains [Tranquillimonas rosea]